MAIICFIFPKMISRKTLLEHRIFASCEKRFCHLLAENVLVWCGSDGMMENFGETGKVLLRFIQRASLAISCVSCRQEQTRFSCGFSPHVMPTDCQDSIPANFRSCVRKHVSSRGRKERANNEQMKFCQARMRRENPLLKYTFFPEIKTDIISMSWNL